MLIWKNARKLWASRALVGIKIKYNINMTIHSRNIHFEVLGNVHVFHCSPRLINRVQDPTMHTSFMPVRLYLSYYNMTSAVSKSNFRKVTPRADRKRFVVSRFSDFVFHDLLYMYCFYLISRETIAKYDS